MRPRNWTRAIVCHRNPHRWVLFHRWNRIDDRYPFQVSPIIHNTGIGLYFFGVVVFQALIFFKEWSLKKYLPRITAVEPGDDPFLLRVFSP